MNLSPLLDPSPTVPPGAEGPVNTFLGYVMWGGGTIALLSLVVIGGIFTANAFGHVVKGAEEIVGRLGWVVLGSSVLAGASGIAKALTGV